MGDDSSDRSLAEDILDRAAIDSGETDSPDTDPGSEQRVRRNQTEHGLEQHLDEQSREALWTYLGSHDQISDIDARQLPHGIDLIVEEPDRTVHHPLTDATGFQREERAYVHGRPEQILELHQASPALYGDPPGDGTTTAADPATPDDTDRIRLQTQIEANLDTASRQGLWTWLDMVSRQGSVAVTRIDTGLRLEAAEEDRDEAYIILASESTGFDPEEQEYIAEHIDDIVALYRADSSLYLEQQSSRI